MEESKRCTKCGEVKLIEEFYKKKNGYINPRCKECVRSDRKEYRNNNKEKIKEAKRRSYLKSGKHKPRVGKTKVVCQHCGKEFSVWPVVIRRGGGKYCSHSCYGSHTSGENNPFFGKKHKPESIEKMRLVKIGTCDSEETKNKKRIANLKRYENPEEHERTSAANKKRFEDPAQREIQRINQIEVFKENPELRNVVSRTFKNKKQSLEHRTKKGLAIRGENNGCWKGGVSFYPYCPKFNNALKERVRSFFGNRCVICGKTPKQNKSKLTVHHVFTEKMACCESKIEEMDSVRKRLPREVSKFGEDKFGDEEIKYIRMMVPLCRSCHGKQNSSSENKVYEETKYRKFFVELILNKYGGKCYSENGGDTK